MAFIDMSRRELTIKLVYYGPALSGKTTNLIQLHRRMQGHTDGELVTLNTRDDRTLFFDLLPLRLSVRGGLSLRVKLFTVPGQVIHNTTRKIVLQGADGVAFVADSRVSQTRANNESFANLRANLLDNGIVMSELGMVIQLNKRDLPGIRTDEEVARIRAKGSEPVYTAVALRGDGVAETFLGLFSQSWRKLERRYGFQERFGVEHDDVVESLSHALGGATP
ncbi:GTP-binding protein [Paraliomyxa miuraensis]|uniref:GTP-binding protein n=1 Tax=Paraliomyxa miuraensis TaxID=376150 RepID=UPI00225AB352|nr:gliding motility protein [Paraliomyxa miuraensis]MCX4245860.1 gliding motility protein [Paraliomyxa miuraensis]